MSRRKDILKDATIYALSSYGAQFFDIVNGILLRRFLGPANMGIWSFLQVIQNYAKHAGLGVTTATARDVPYYLGKGDTEKANEIKNLVFTFTFFTSLIAAAGIVIYALLRRETYSQPIILGLIVVAAIVVLQRIYNLYVVLLRAYKEFIFAGKLNVVSSIVTLSMTVLLVWKFQLYGFFAGLILHYLIVLLFILKQKPYRFSLFFDWKKLRPLLNLGTAMLIADILRTVIVSIDRIMIAKFLGFTALGYYSVALMANNYLYALPNMLGIIFFPHFQEVFAKNDDPRDLEKYLREPTLCVAYVFPLLMAAVWIGSEWLIPVLLPQYINGIPALRLLVLASYFTALIHPFMNYIITVRRHWHLIPLQAVLIPVGFGLSWVLIRAGWGLEGVAFTMVIVSVAQFIILSWVSLSMIHAAKATFKLYGQVSMVFAVTVAALFGIASAASGMVPSFLKCVMLYAAFIVVMLPFLFLAEREVKLITTFKEFLRRKKQKKLKED